MDRAQKAEFVETLHETFQNAGAIVVSHYAGLNVAQMTEYRSLMREAGGKVKVAKNNLAKRALTGTDAAGMAVYLEGQTVLAYSDDPVSAPKVTIDFAKKHEKLVVLGGAMGTTVLDPESVKALAALPSLDELRGKLVGLLNAPAGKIAQVVSAPGAQLARVLQAKADKEAA